MKQKEVFCVSNYSNIILKSSETHAFKVCLCSFHTMQLNLQQKTAQIVRFFLSIYHI